MLPLSIGCGTPLKSAIGLVSEIRSDDDIPILTILYGHRSNAHLKAGVENADHFFRRCRRGQIHCGQVYLGYFGPVGS